MKMYKQGGILQRIPGRCKQDKGFRHAGSRSALPGAASDASRASRSSGSLDSQVRKEVQSSGTVKQLKAGLYSCHVKPVMSSGGSESAVCPPGETAGNRHKLLAATAFAPAKRAKHRRGYRAGPSPATCDDLAKSRLTGVSTTGSSSTGMSSLSCARCIAWLEKQVYLPEPEAP